MDEYSAGLHAATVCLDQHLPWGDSATPLDEREDALARTAAALTEQETYPFDPQTVVDQGLVGECVDWGLTPPDEESDARELPDVPTLFLIGDHDLSTSWEWARQEVRVAPDPTVMVVKGAGHGVQRSAGEFPEVLTRIQSFLCLVAVSTSARSRPRAKHHPGQRGAGQGRTEHVGGNHAGGQVQEVLGESDRTLGDLDQQQERRRLDHRLRSGPKGYEQQPDRERAQDVDRARVHMRHQLRVQAVPV